MKIARQAVLLLCLSILVIVSWMAPLDDPAVEQVDAGLKRALVSFASARAVSGVISVLQGTEIDVMPAGIGATFAPGQVLAPINELVKHFSDLMLVASVSFGIQKVLIGMSGYWAISLVLTIAALGWASFYLLKRQPPAFLSKMLVVLLMLRFAVPVAVLGSDFLAQKFMAADYAESQNAINTAMGQASRVAITESPATAPVITPVPLPPQAASPASAPASDPVSAPASTERAKPWWRPSLPKVHMPTMPNLPTLSLPKLPSIPDFAGRFEEMKAAAEQATEHMVKLMAIFLLQTLVLPILMLWGLYGLAKGVFQLPKRMPDFGLGIESASGHRGSNEGIGR